MRNTLRVLLVLTALTAGAAAQGNSDWHAPFPGFKIAGNLYYVGTAEMIFPLGLPNEFGIKGRVFTQAGSLFDIHEKEIPTNPIADSRALRVTAGFGISWTSPFGPIRVDLGFPLMKEKEDETEVFRFNFGTRF